MYFRQSQPHSNAGQQFSQQCWGWPARCFQHWHPVTCISNCMLAVLRKVKCVCQSLVACLPIFVQCFFPALPPSLVQGQVREKNILVGKDSTDQFIVTVPGGAPRRVAMVYTSFLVLEHCPAPPTLQAPVPKLICW